MRDTYVVLPNDHVEFLSNAQTDKGPSTGRVVRVEDNGRYMHVRHSDTIERFHIGLLALAKLSTHTLTGRRLWIFE